MLYDLCLSNNMKLAIVAATILAVFVLSEVTESAEGTKIIGKIKETWRNIKKYFHRHNATVPCNSAEENTTDLEVIPEEQIDPRFCGKFITKRDLLHENHNKLD